nr:hypothetical protein [Kitasatospora azatica]
MPTPADREFERAGNERDRLLRQRPGVDLSYETGYQLNGVIVREVEPFPLQTAGRKQSMERRLQLSTASECRQELEPGGGTALQRREPALQMGSR